MAAASTYDVRHLEDAPAEDIVFCVDVHAEVGLALQGAATQNPAAVVSPPTTDVAHGGDNSCILHELVAHREENYSQSRNDGGRRSSSSPILIPSVFLPSTSSLTIVTRLDVIRQAILLFIHCKLALNPHHRFAIATLGGFSITAGSSGGGRSRRAWSERPDGGQSELESAPGFHWVGDNQTRKREHLTGGIGGQTSE